MASESLPVPKRKLIDVTNHQAMPNVEIGIAVFEVGVALVAEITIAERAQGGVGCVVQSVSVGIGRFKLQPVRKALLQADLQGIVIGETVGAEQVDPSIENFVAIGRENRVVA